MGCVEQIEIHTTNRMLLNYFFSNAYIMNWIEINRKYVLILV